jgi:NADPH:quinone reductase-like Zn-dependent oxidoreductase
MTMKAMQISSFGDAGVLEPVEVPVPDARSGEVLVKIKACGLNHLDLRVRRGEFPELALPLIPGSDIAGIIDETGERVVVYPILPCGRCAFCVEGHEHLCRDIRLIGVHKHGGYAECIAVPRANAIPVPDSLDLTGWAATPIVFLTAWHALVTRANLRVGESILIHSAGSGLGTAAVQIASAGGARVIVTAGTAEKLEHARRLGAHETINYHDVDFAEAVFELTKGAGVDVVLDHVGGATLVASISCLSRGGRLLCCGETGSPSATIALRPLFNRERVVMGSYLGTRKEFLDVLSLLGKKTLKPVVDASFPLARAGEAQDYLEERHAFGKVVLTVP